MKVLLDTNIVIDFLTAREPFGELAKEVFELVELKKIEGYLSSSSITTIHYLLTKVFDKNRADDTIQKLLELFFIATIDKEGFKDAINLNGYDFEDSVIIQSAINKNIDIIISRDKKGFKNSPILTLEPREFLATFEV